MTTPAAPSPVAPKKKNYTAAIIIGLGVPFGGLIAHFYGAGLSPLQREFIAGTAAGLWTLVWFKLLQPKSPPQS